MNFPTFSSYNAGRPRISNTCRECKRRKVRCDKKRPACSRCARNGVQCIYDQLEMDVGRHPGIQFLGPIVAEEPAFHGGSSNPPPVSQPMQPPSADAYATDRLKHLEERLESLTGIVRALQSSQASNATTSSPDRATRPEEDERPSAAAPRPVPLSPDVLEEVAIGAPLGHLAVQAGGRTRYISGTHWGLIYDDLDEIEALLRSQTRYDLHPPRRFESPSHEAHRGSFVGSIASAPPAWDLSKSASTQVRQHTNPIFDELPDRESCAKLVEAYVWNFHPVVPVIHVPTFRKVYEKFWESQYGEQTIVATHNLPLVVAVLFAGSVVCSEEIFRSCFGGDSRREEISAQLHAFACDALQISHFPRVPKVESLTAYLVVQGTWMRDEEPLQACSFVGLAVRVAQMLGLNKDPSLFPSLQDPILAEVRRRLWWHVFHVDVLVAIASGLPPLIDRGSWNVRIPIEVGEEYIGTPLGIQYTRDLASGRSNSEDAGVSGSVVSPLGIFLQVAARDLLNKAFGQSQMTFSDIRGTQQDLIKLQNNIATRMSRVPSEIHIAATYESNQEYNLWVRLVLCCMGRKNWWFLHSSLFHPAISQAWSELRPQVINSCRLFLQNFVCLSCLDEFQRFQWAWPGNHQPLHAMMLLLREIDRNPEDGIKQGSCAVIDEILALCRPEGGVSGTNTSGSVPRPLTEGGQEAWDMIKRLRGRVWIKAGLDPDVIPAPTDVITLAKGRLNELLELSSMEQHEPMDVPDLSASHRENEGLIETSLAAPEAFTPNLNWDSWDELFGEPEFEPSDATAAKQR